MAGLTVTEKEHWKERIARGIDKRIESILATSPTQARQLCQKVGDLHGDQPTDLERGALEIKPVE